MLNANDVIQQKFFEEWFCANKEKFGYLKTSNVHELFYKIPPLKYSYHSTLITYCFMFWVAANSYINTGVSYSKEDISEELSKRLAACRFNPSASTESYSMCWYGSIERNS